MLCYIDRYVRAHKKKKKRQYNMDTLKYIFIYYQFLPHGCTKN